MEYIDVCPYCDRDIDIMVYSYSSICCPYCDKYINIDIESSNTIIVDIEE